MVVVGVDAHKRTHTCVAVDSSGRKLGEKTVPATTVGNASALRWALSTFGPELTWGIEDVRNVSRRLEQELVKAGQRVVRVPTTLMARTRASARTRGKSDSIDATAVARAVLREPDLPSGPARFGVARAGAAHRAARNARRTAHCDGQPRAMAYPRARPGPLDQAQTADLCQAP